MTEKRYCIICGEEIQSSDPDMVFCSEHGGPKGSSPRITQPKEITSDAKDVIPQPILDKNTSWQRGQVILDTYKVIDQLGEGGFGQVYRVHHTGWNMDLAVKRPRADKFKTKKAKLGFIKEAETWVDLGLHPHITSCYYVRMVDEMPHVFVECMEGGSLESWIQRKNGNLYAGSDKEILWRLLDIAIQFAWGIEFAHSQNLVHRDIKPQNALMTPDGILKVTDFGLARGKGIAQGEQQVPSQKIKVSGIAYDPYHCSPEQVVGRVLSQKTDIWSWGVSVLQMFNGRITWAGGQIADSALESYLSSGGESYIPKMPDDLAGVIKGCLQRDPEERPANMHHIAEKVISIYQKAKGVAYPRERPKAVDLRGDSLNNKALTLLDLGKTEDAVDAWQEALRIDTHHPEAMYNYHLLQWRQSSELDDLEFVQKLEGVIASQPGSWKPYYHLIEVHLERGDSEAISQLLKNAPKNFPEAIIKEIDHSSREIKNSRHWLTISDATPPITLTPDGKRIVTVNSTTHRGSLQGGSHKIPSYSLMVFDVSSGRQLLKIPMDGIYRVEKLLLTPDGSRAIISCASIVVVWELNYQSKGSILRGGKLEVVDVVLDSSGEKLLISNQYSVSLWRLSDLKCLYTGKMEYSRCAAITPDGQFGIIGLRNGVIQILNLSDLHNQETEQLLHQSLVGHSDVVSSLAITPDGTLLVSGSYDKSLRVWDMNDGDCIHVMSGHSKGIGKILITPDGNRVISLAFDGTIRVWDMKSGCCQHVLTAKKQYVNTMTLSPDGKLLLTGDNDELLRVWDMETGACLRSFSGHKHDIKGIVVTQDNSFAISAEQEQYEDVYELLMWGLEGIGKVKANWALSLPQSYVKVKGAASESNREIDSAEAALKDGNFKEAGKALKKMQKISGYERDPRWLALWRQAGSQGGKAVGVLFEREIWHLKGHSEPIWTVACSSDGKLAASAGYEGVIQVWDLESGQSIHQLDRHGMPVGGLAFTPDNQLLLSSGNDHRLRLWDIQSGAERRVFEGHKSILYGVDISKDGKRILSGGADRDISLWELESGKRIRTLIGHGNWVYSVVFTPDGKYALSGGDDADLYIWNLASGQCEAKLQGHYQRINCVAVSPDGSQAITAGDDEKLLYWDLQRRQLIRELTGHQGVVRTTVITPDGDYAFSSGEDHTLRVWDLSNGKCIRIIDAHQNIVTSMALAGDGCHLVTGSADTIVKLWAFTWDYKFGRGLFGK